MTTPSGSDQTNPRPPSPLSRLGQRGMIVVAALVAVVLLVVGGIIGLAIAPSTTAARSDEVTPNAVDTGFAQDMGYHHAQGVTLAQIAYNQSTDGDVKKIAYEIQTEQTSEIGMMDGWLDLWGDARSNLGARMTWMSTNGSMDMNMGGATVDMTVSAADAADGAVMPGMATNTEVNKLRSMTGTALDVYFLQLMIRHHEGGIPMMAYAAAHAAVPNVRTQASKMETAQGNEILVMVQMLDQRKAAPLPFSLAAVATSGLSTSGLLSVGGTVSGSASGSTAPAIGGTSTS